ncbi:MAG TPA: helix-turn-helix domain-containing protein [Saprospiraceae bacterium]|nr:helix-turn-helix domain-containing protein [Saprospiraceae bacterium]
MELTFITCKHPLLSQFVSGFFTIESTGNGIPRNPFIHIPDGTIDLVFNLGDPYFRKSAIYSNFDANITSATLCSQRSSATIIKSFGDIEVFGVRFQPDGIYPFCKLGMHELVNQAVDPQLIFKNDFNKLFYNVYNTKDSIQKIDVITNFFLSELNRGIEIDYCLQSLIKYIQSKNGNIRIKDVIRLFNCSQRSLEMRSRQRMGLSLKELSRILRFKYFVLLHDQSPTSNLTDLCYQAGYFDQSHLIHECKKITGVNPSEYINIQRGIPVL